MAPIIPIGNPHLKMDLQREADILAVNEACAGTGAARSCSLDNMCIDCKCLSNALYQALIRAFAAGQASVLLAKDEDGGRT